MAKKTAEAPLGEGEFILRLINPEGETVHEERTSDPGREEAYRLGVEVRNAEPGVDGWRYEKKGREPEPSEPVEVREVSLDDLKAELTSLLERAQAVTEKLEKGVSRVDKN